MREPMPAFPFSKDAPRLSELCESLLKLDAASPSECGPLQFFGAFIE